jgi:hypothetical protein
MRRMCLSQLRVASGDTRPTGLLTFTDLIVQLSRVRQEQVIQLGEADQLLSVRECNGTSASVDHIKLHLMTLVLPGAREI